MGTTVLVASMRDEGHTFHERRMPMFKMLILTILTTIATKRTVSVFDVFEIEHGVVELSYLWTTRIYHRTK